MDDLDRTPDREDLREAQHLRSAAYEMEKQGENPAALHAQADAMFLRIARYLVARELPGVEFPEKPVGDGMDYVCGGARPNARDLCQELVWLYGSVDGPSGMRQVLLDEKLMFLDVFCGALSPRAHQSATGPILTPDRERPTKTTHGRF